MVGKRFVPKNVHIDSKKRTNKLCSVVSESMGRKSIRDLPLSMNSDAISEAAVLGVCKTLANFV